MSEAQDAKADGGEVQTSKSIIRCPECGYHMEYRESRDTDTGELEETWYECLSCGCLSSVRGR